MLEEASHDEVAEESLPAEGSGPQEGSQDAEPAEPKKQKTFNQEKYDKVIDAWSRALGAEASTPPFAGDLENPLYLSIIAGIKSFKPELYVPPEPKAEGE